MNRIVWPSVTQEAPHILESQFLSDVWVGILILSQKGAVLRLGRNAGIF